MENRKRSQAKLYAVQSEPQAWLEAHPELKSVRTGKFTQDYPTERRNYPSAEGSESLEENKVIRGPWRPAPPPSHEDGGGKGAA